MQHHITRRATYHPGDLHGRSGLTHLQPAPPPQPATRLDETWLGYFHLLKDALEDAAARAPDVNRALPSDDDTDENIRAYSSRSSTGTTTGGRWTIYSVSDLHTDMKANMAWVRDLPKYPPRTALIVAGDVATSMSVIRETLSLLKDKFEEVFYCPVRREALTLPPGRRIFRRCLNYFPY